MPVTRKLCAEVTRRPPSAVARRAMPLLAPARTVVLARVSNTATGWPGLRSTRRRYSRTPGPVSAPGSLATRARSSSLDTWASRVARVAARDMPSACVGPPSTRRSTRGCDGASATRRTSTSNPSRPSVSATVSATRRALPNMDSYTTRALGMGFLPPTDDLYAREPDDDATRYKVPAPWRLHDDDARAACGLGPPRRLDGAAHDGRDARVQPARPRRARLGGGRDRACRARQPHPGARHVEQLRRRRERAAHRPGARRGGRPARGRPARDQGRRARLGLLGSARAGLARREPRAARRRRAGSRPPARPRVPRLRPRDRAGWRGRHARRGARVGRGARDRDRKSVV